jgi:SAM-dependent methyltransferase
MKKRGVVRDLFVYVFVSTKYLFLKGKIALFLNDIKSFRRWRKYRNVSGDILKFRTPWLVFGAIDFLERYLTKDMLVFEYGSGGSTIFFSDRAGQVVSVEHNPEWYKIALNFIQQEAITNIDYHLVEPTNDPDYFQKTFSNPAHFISTFNEYKGMHFEDYVKTIDHFPNHYFDLVIVDGRARNSCILHAAQHVKKNGILLVDNAERSHYLENFPELTDGNTWEPLVYIGHFPFCPASVLTTTKLFIRKI